MGNITSKVLLILVIKIKVFNKLIYAKGFNELEWSKFSHGAYPPPLKEGAIVERKQLSFANICSALCIISTLMLST